MKMIRLGLIGAGERGAQCYAPYALKYPEEVSFVCVAEPIVERRNTFSEIHGIAEKDRYSSWEELLSAGYNLDGVIIATQDREHYEPAMAAISAGYNILLEKPIAETVKQAQDIVVAAQRKGVFIMVCHVLRYTPFFRSIKDQIEHGLIGDIQSIHHIENIGYWHFSHSYVRGNWNRVQNSSPMIVAKCSHDTDIFNFLLGGQRCLSVSSLGRLSHFTKDNMPFGATDRCTSGCPHNKSCIYSAYKYLEDRKLRSVFKDIIMRTSDNQKFLDYLKTTPYSRCVYQSDNDVVDHQVVIMGYESGATVSWQASAFTMDTTRHTKIMGTLGEIEGVLDDDRYTIRDFGSGNVTTIHVHTPQTLHSGGDACIMEAFVGALRYPEKDRSQLDVSLSLHGHIMAFAAEESRQNEGNPVQL